MVTSFIRDWQELLQSVSDAAKNWDDHSGPSYRASTVPVQGGRLRYGSR
jgi:hypothetical protein